MAYLDNLFGPHAGNLNRALNKTSERQSLLMKNLANVNTPGYKREDMDFSIMLDEKMDEFDTMVAERSLKSKRSSESSLRPDKNNVDLEMEVMSIAETEARFNALTELTGRYFSGLKNVIREGR
ncbi:MAG: flagellar basal body rod protein FlgB [Armatimonadota bacterium]|nr:flagellar basal body rod protein FlgB [Fimbriimonadaceae bacterium]MCX6341601.1 flagellar basal body rod protein FlgB [Fimbriimonadales bacterium]